ncbi:AAA family ATPase [Halomonas sp. H5]|uniref:AAA family ATPase n=1 Tax=Halomonas sp. H5 TaxID=3423910 RepID=UPI003D36BAFB
MPRITEFNIKNFKGAEDVKIELEGRSSSPVHTIIGLNESGKSTLLEAISHFVTGDKSIASLFDGPYAQASALSLIPLHKKAAFTGKITVEGTIQLDEGDIEKLENIAKSMKLSLDTEKLRPPFHATRTFRFEDSSLEESNTIWDIPVFTKNPRAVNYKPYSRPKRGSDEPDLWLRLVGYIQSRLEQVAYFPTFLVDMPARVYLKEHDSETPINRQYRYVLQDVLDSLGEGLDLEKHVCKRIEEFEENESNPFWLSMFFGSPSKTPIDSVFQKLSNSITREVLGSWQRIFQRSISANSITVEWNVDTEKENLPYAAFFVSDGESRYAINERSLGFRWFFSFLLFTGFKQANSRRTIFIFDEPAANLHAKAQAELLSSFSKIASGGSRIIYSTHSHHMINPRWLCSAYIVENSALDYDRSDNFGLDTKPTKITAIPYRQFVANFPTRSSYFQPVIEKLEYVPPEVIGSGPYLVVEGVSDYYALRLAKEISDKSYSFNLVPGVGSGASGPIISQMLGQGMSFSILLDDDKEGRKARDSYRDNWYLPESLVVTLGDVLPDYERMALEKLLGEETLELARNKLDLTKSPSKKQLGWYLAEACASNDNHALPKIATDRLLSVLDYFENYFKSYDSQES